MFTINFGYLIFLQILRGTFLIQNFFPRTSIFRNIHKKSILSGFNVPLKIWRWKLSEVVPDTQLNIFNQFKFFFSLPFFVVHWWWNNVLTIILQIKLAEHSYSNLFGTFLCNSSEERQRLTISQRTYSVWRYLNAPHFRNYLYDRNFERVSFIRFVVIIWTKFYIFTNFGCLRTSDI